MTSKLANSLSPQASKNSQNPNGYVDLTDDIPALRAEFCKIFGYGWDFLEKKKNPEAPWKTVKKYKAAENIIWYKLTDPQTVIGLRFGSETKYGLYDIDFGSSYHPWETEKAIISLKGELENWGIHRIIPIQSSASHGIHLYFFLSEAVSTFSLACVMRLAITNAGLELKRGQLETFPNTKAWGNKYNGHRLPLQQGSELLDRDYQPCSHQISDLISAANWSAEGNDLELLKTKLANARAEFVSKRKQHQHQHQPNLDFPKDLAEMLNYAQRDIKEGFMGQIRLKIESGYSGAGETNDLLLTIARLGRIYYGHSGKEYIDYIKQTITKCPGYERYCHHKHEIEARCQQVAKYGEKQWSPYCSSAPGTKRTYKDLKLILDNFKPNQNDQRHEAARERVKQAVEKIEQEKQRKLPKRVGESKLLIRNTTKEIFGISVSDKTLNKADVLPLWHPRYRAVPIQLATTEPTSKNKQESGSTNQSGKSKIEPKIVAAQATEKSILQKNIQPEESTKGPSNICAIPSNVVHQHEPESKNCKARSSKQSETSCHTLPLMKGMFSLFYLEQVSLILRTAYFNLLNQRRDLLLTCSVCSSAQELACPRGLVSKVGQPKAKVEIIPEASEVEVLRNEFHSWCYRDKPELVFVYVRPVNNPERWQNGIAVKLEHLTPARLKQRRDCKIICVKS